MSNGRYQSVALSQEAYKSLLALRGDLAAAGTLTLPESLRPETLSLSEIVLVGVKATRSKMRGRK